MQKKRRQKKKKVQTLPPLSAEEESRLSALLENPEEISPAIIPDQIPGPRFAQALLERLPAHGPEIVDLILALRDTFKEKNVQKAVKKALFKIKQRGIRITDQASGKKQEPVIKRMDRAEPSAYLGPIDGTGSRGLLMIVPRLTKGVDVGIGLVNDEEGITYFIFDRYSKKRSKEVKNFFFEQAGMEIDTSVAHAATILEKAYGLHGLAPGEASIGYLKLRPWILENTSFLERPAVYDLIPPEIISGEDLTDSQAEKLLGHELMNTWIIAPEKIQPLLEEIAKVEESPILVSEGQKVNRIEEIKEKAIAKLYPDSKRQLFRDRLEETAYLFLRLNNEEYARLCLSAASCVVEEISHVRPGQFLKALTERSIDYYIGVIKEGAKPEEQEKSSPSGIIISGDI